MTTCQASINSCGVVAPPATHERLRSATARLLETLRLWHERAQRRRELVDMPDYLLRDMGITREELSREMQKPFWRA